MKKLFIHFPDVDRSVANQLVLDLQDHLGAEGTEVLRERNDSMDFGTILAVLLGAKSVTEIAKGVSAWISGRQDVKISVKDETGEFVIENVSSKDVAVILKAIKDMKVDVA